MGFETIHTAGHPNAAKRLAPGNGVRFVAILGGEGIRRAGAPPDEAVNLFLDIDERCFHGRASINLLAATRKPAAKFAAGGAADAGGQVIRKATSA